MSNGGKMTKIKFALAVFLITSSSIICIWHTAEAADTLRIPTIDVVSGLDDARSLVMRSDGELIITEAGTQRILSCRIDAGVEADISTEEDISNETDISKEKEISNETDTLMASEKQRYVPDLDQPDGLSLVMDTYTAVVSAGSGHVHLLDEDLSYMRSVAVPSWALGDSEFRPNDVTSNEFGELFVLDSMARRVYHFNANGGYLQNFDLRDMERPERLSYYSESLFITDSAAGKIHILTDDGRSLATIGTFPSLARVRIIDDVIWVLSGEVVHLFSISGEHVGNLMTDLPSIHFMDAAGSDSRVFLLTSGSLYFWNLEQ